MTARGAERGIIFSFFFSSFNAFDVGKNVFYCCGMMISIVSVSLGANLLVLPPQNWNHGINFQNLVYKSNALCANSSKLLVWKKRHKTRIIISIAVNAASNKKNKIVSKGTNNISIQLTKLYVCAREHRCFMCVYVPSSNTKLAGYLFCRARLLSVFL